MKLPGIHNHVLARLFWALLLFAAQSFRAMAAPEATFDVLQAGTKTYQNVTVTTKAKDYIFIVHSAGMTTLRVTNLPPEALKRLGYAEAESPKTHASSPSTWAKQTVAKVEGPKVKGMEEQWKNWRSALSAASLHLPPISTKLIAVVSVLLVAVCLLAGYCCKLIVEKTGNDPGILVWLPVLQILPLLRAAGLPFWWFFAWLIPGLNLVASVIWCLKIAEARGKSVWFAILLLLPVIGFFAFLYLAFSNGGRAGKDDRRIEIMTLETA
jgi:hypothetical protein